MKKISWAAHPIAVASALVLLACPVTVVSQEPPPSSESAKDPAWAVSGHLLTNAYSSDKLLSDKRLAGSVALHLDLKQAATAAGGLRVDVDVLRQQDVLGSHDWIRPREVTWVLDTGPGRFTAGWMTLNMGKSDAFNPSDFFVTYDYTLLRPSEAEWRNARLLAKYDWPVSEGSQVSLIVAPYTAGNRLPQERELSSLPRRGGDGAGDGSEVALRYETSSSALDWSMTAWQGITKDPVLQPVGTGLVRTYPHAKGLGADLAKAVGVYGLHAEAAYQWLDTQRDSGAGSFLFAVAGVERTFDSLNVGWQVLYRHKTSPPAQGDSAPWVRANALLFSQTRRVQYGNTLRLTYRNPVSAWDTEAFLVRYAGPASSTYARLTIGYEHAPKSKFTWGVEQFSGGGNTAFGALKLNRLAFIQYQLFFE